MFLCMREGLLLSKKKALSCYRTRIDVRKQRMIKELRG